MTVQIPEQMLDPAMSTTKFLMLSDPLTPYLRSKGIHNLSKYSPSCLHRGHVGSWMLKDGKLWLLKVKVWNSDEHVYADLRELSPDHFYRNKVFADWVNGWITIELDQKKWDTSFPYKSRFMHYLFENGILQKREWDEDRRFSFEDPFWYGR